jgi:cytochrome c nitrite reductase small subunit
VAKADQGFRHSLAFTLQNFKEPIEIVPRDRQIVRTNCVRCHADLVHAVTGDAPGPLDCLHCHAGAGHGAGG